MNDNRKFHIQITLKEAKPPHKRREWDCDLSAEELEKRYIAPYRQGRAIVIDGRVIALDEIHRARVYWTDRDIRNFAAIPWGMMKDATDELMTGPPGWELETQGGPNQQPRPARDAREVFVVHGRNDTAREAMFAFLRSIDLIPLEWNVAREDTGKPSPYIGEILQAAFSRAHVLVVLLTPDDEARLKPQFRADADPPYEIQLTGQARPNVLFEAGMAMGGQPDRAVLVELGNLRPFTDIAGLHIVRMDNSSQRRQELAQKLRTAGCPINLNGEYWHTAGDFESAVAEENDNRDPRFEQPPELQNSPPISDDARELLYAARSEDATIMAYRVMPGLVIRTRNRVFAEPGDTRSAARWKSALEELEQSSLIEALSDKREVFQLTHAGFAMADTLNENQKEIEIESP